MTIKQLQAIELMVETDLTQKEIAAKIDINEATISRWKQRSDFKERLEKHQKKFLGSMTSEAMRTLKALLRSENEYVRYNTAKDILDRNGYKASDKQEIKLDGDIGINERLDKYREYLENDT